MGSTEIEQGEIGLRLRASGFRKGFHAEARRSRRRGDGETWRGGRSRGLWVSGVPLCSTTERSIAGNQFRRNRMMGLDRVFTQRRYLYMRLLVFVALVLGLLLVGVQTFAQDAIGSRQVLYHNGFEAGGRGDGSLVGQRGVCRELRRDQRREGLQGQGHPSNWISHSGPAQRPTGKEPTFYIPLKGSPTVRGALLVEKGSARLGFGFYGGASGMCGGGGEYKQLPSGWQEWESKNEPSLVDTDHLEWVAVYINSPASENVVLYLDEFEVVGTTHA